MVRIKRTVAVVAATLGLYSGAHATPLVNTLLATGDTGDAGRTLNSLSSVAQSFVADSTGIGDIELELGRTGAATGSIVITIYSDASGLPGSQFGTFKITVPESSIPATETLFDFYNISLGQPLTVGAKYWVDVAKSGSISSETFATSRTNTGGSATTYFRGVSPAVTTSSMAICISDDNSCDAVNHVTNAAYAFNQAPQQATPEPASAALVGVALIGIGTARRRLVRRKAGSLANVSA